MSNKSNRNKTHHDFLHTFFPKSEGYQEIEVNGFWLINQQNIDGTWNVAIMTKESFENRNNYLNNKI